LKDSCSRFRHSTSPQLAETSQAVRIADRSPFPLAHCPSPIAPALVGNVVVWKPSPAATYSNYIIHQILTEAGVPPGVIQFVPGPPPDVVAQAIAHPEFAGLHFTGSTFVFKKLWKDIATNIDSYKSYPRIVGETGARFDGGTQRGEATDCSTHAPIGGKNFHVVHKSAEIRNAVLQSVRAAFEYQGQKCSALSRLYVSASAWNSGFKDQFLAEIAKIRVGPPQDFGNFMGPVMCVSSVTIALPLLTDLFQVASPRLKRLPDTFKEQKKQVVRS